MSCEKTVPAYKYDLLLRLFISLYSRSWLLLFAIAAAANYGTLAVLAYVSRVYFQVGGLRPPLVGDWFAYANWIVVVPALYVVLTKFTVVVHEVVSRLNEGNVVQNPRMDEHSSWLLRRMGSLWIPVLSLVLAIIAGIWGPRWHDFPDTHWTGFGGAGVRYFVIVEDTIKAYLLLALGIRIALTMDFLRKVFWGSNKAEAGGVLVKIEPLHPDRCGGLGFLGSMSAYLNLTLGVLALNIVLAMVAREVHGYESFTTLNIIELVVYVILSPALFLLPLYFPRHHMKRAKERFLADLSGNFEKQYAEILSSIRQNLPLKNEEVEGILNVRQLYDIGAKMPVWPFDFQTLLRVLTTVVLPIAIAIIGKG